MPTTSASTAVDSMAASRKANRSVRLWASCVNAQRVAAGTTTPA